MPVGWSMKGFRDEVGLSGGVGNAGDGAPLRKGLFLGKLTVRPGEIRLSRLEQRREELAKSLGDQDHGSGACWLRAVTESSFRTCLMPDWGGG